VISSRPLAAASLDELPAGLVLEVDALCDDFERRWRRSQRCGTSLPVVETFLARIGPAGRSALEQCLRELERELRAGVVLPDVPGLRIEEEIGRGGMGVVYRARRVEDGRPVALKLIPGAEHARWSRWVAELADLRHPNLVPLDAFGTHDGLHYVVMPLIAGGDLKERLSEFVVGPDGSQAALRRVATLVEKVAGAVDFLHRRGILHRDLKPSNILLLPSHSPAISPHPPAPSPTKGRGGEKQREADATSSVFLPLSLLGRGDRGVRERQRGVKECETVEPLVCDFGLAGRLDEASAGVVGTPAYMAPEQRKGQPLTAAADVWSLGAVLCELLTGRAPFDASEQLAAVAEPLRHICLRCLEDEPAARYSSAAELTEDLRRYLE
jgi:serine/threonine protein kinase